MIVPNNSVATQDALKIRVAGQDWPVPKLAPRQNRKVLPALMRLRALQKKGPNGEQEDITEAQYDDLMDVVYYALTRAHPQLKREEFLDWPVETYELLAAMPIVALQTGMVKTTENPQMGEAQPAPAPEPTNSQTGTESSSTA